MDVFIRNIPARWTEETMMAELKPVMSQLAIPVFACHKRVTRTYGIVTVLHAAEGERFLQAHGQQAIGPTTRSRLTLGGCPALCSESRHPAYVKVLRGLAYEAEHEGKVKARAKRAETRAEPTKFPMVSIACGNLFTAACDGCVFVSEWDWCIPATVRFSKRNVSISCEGGLRRVLIPTYTVHELIWSAQHKAVTLVLTEVPRILGASITAKTITTSAKMDRLQYIKPEQAAVVSCCLVYHLQLCNDDFQSELPQLKQMMSSVLERNLPAFGPRRYYPRTFPDEARRLDHILGQHANSGTLPFDLLFLVQALSYGSYVHPRDAYTLLQSLHHGYYKLPPDERKYMFGAVQSLFLFIPIPSPDHTCTPADMISHVKQAIKNRHNSADLTAGINRENTARVYRASVTPTRVTLHGPEMESMNQLLRLFRDHHDYFVRVRFYEENGMDLSCTPSVSLEGIYTRFKTIMLNGFWIAGRNYSFLGFSHSSLRSHTAWFFAPFEFEGRIQTYGSILGRFGDFAPIRCPARCAACIGQIFSETPSALPLRENGIYVGRLDEVTSANGRRVFSDGVGSVSPKALEVLRRYLPESKRPEHATCLQIRCAGAKGMIALDTRLHGSVVYFRPSMIKFGGVPIASLEICDVGSKPLRFFLNQQLIKILEDIGVPDAWFQRLQEDEVSRLRQVTSSVKRTVSFLEYSHIGDVFQLPKLFRSFKQDEYHADPFLRAVVEAPVLRELRLLKHKARIPIAQGVTLFGVLDETGFLAEGQIYITYDTLEGHHLPPPGAQKVLISRSLALHPGDVQLVNNIIPPEGHPLRSHQNCVVFSQHGARDLPSMLAGGDLDGDIYGMIWDTEALYCADGTPLKIHHPADYPRVLPLELDRQVTRQDMASFFVDFMKTDRVGIIARRHMIAADDEAQGTLAQTCLLLAAVHSTVVDFSKTGRAVTEILPGQKTYRPDFLSQGRMAQVYEKSTMDLREDDSDNGSDDDGMVGHKYYRSEKILGRLYRAIDEEPIWHHDVKRSATQPDTSDLSRDLGALTLHDAEASTTAEKATATFWKSVLDQMEMRCEGVGYGRVQWEDKIEDARRIRYGYEAALWDLRKKFSDHPRTPLRELEVFLGFIINKTGIASRRQRDRSTKLKDKFEQLASATAREMRTHLLEKTSGQAHIDTLDTLELCLACVFVGCSGLVPGTEELYVGNGSAAQLESFKVLAAGVLNVELIKIYRGRP